MKALLISLKPVNVHQLAATGISTNNSPTLSLHQLFHTTNMPKLNPGSLLKKASMSMDISNGNNSQKHQAISLFFCCDQSLTNLTINYSKANPIIETLFSARIFFYYRDRNKKVSK